MLIIMVLCEMFLKRLKVRSCMFFILIFFFLQSVFGANFTPEGLFADGYGLPNNLTMQCVNVINGNVPLGNDSKLEEIKNKRRNFQTKRGCLNEKFNQEMNSSSIFNIFFSQTNINSFNISTPSISSVNTPSSSDSENEDKKRKQTKDTSAALLGGGAAVMGLIGLGAYVWDYCQFKKHPKKGCDYWLDHNGAIQVGAYYETHQASRWNASTIIQWPDFHMGAQAMQVNFLHFYSDGIISFENRAFLYGRDFTSLYNALAEKFYMKEVDTHGQCLNFFVLPTKPKKIVYSNGSFVMLSYDGYVYYKTASSNTFERLYIKTSLNYFFEETVVDIVSSSDLLVLWTHSGQLIKIIMDPNSNFPVQLSTVTVIPIGQRKEYRIIDCQNKSFTLGKTDCNAVLNSKNYSANYFTVMNSDKCNFYMPINERTLYLKNELSFFKRLLYEGYRFIVNRPFKCMSISCFGLSLFLYMKYLKKR